MDQTIDLDEERGTACEFCEAQKIEDYILTETPHFRLATDHAPLVEGHLLIIPKEHYTCYGDVPSSLDAEFLALKQKTQDFLERYYRPVIFWEHGIYHQSVFHAHLHCFPFGPISYDPATDLHAQLIHSQDELRAWHHQYNYYFYLEDAHQAYLFKPETDNYTRIIRDVLLQGVHQRDQQFRSPDERIKRGRPWIASTLQRWHEYIHEYGD